MVVELFMVVRFHSGGLAKFCGFTVFHGGGGGYWSPSIVRVCEIATRRLMLMFVMLTKDSGWRFHKLTLCICLVPWGPLTFLHILYVLLIDGKGFLHVQWQWKRKWVCSMFLLKVPIRRSFVVKRKVRDKKRKKRKKVKWKSFKKLFMGKGKILNFFYGFLYFS